MVSIVSLATVGNGPGPDDPRHCHFDGRAAALPMVPAKGNLSGWLDLNLPAAARPIHLDWLPDQRTMDEPAS